MGNYPWAGGYPKLAVYTSPDLLAWTFRAPLLIGGQEGWIPNVFYDAQRQRFVCWYGVGDWGVGASLRASPSNSPPLCSCPPPPPPPLLLPTSHLPGRHHLYRGEEPHELAPGRPDRRHGRVY